MIDTLGTGAMDDDKISVLVRKNFELTPRGIIKSLNL